jgi:hypothetical protein
MKPRLLGSALVALIVVGGVQDSLSAQVVEERDSQANPAAAIFRATLFGAGTGLVLGGAYALVETGDASTEDILKWGVAGGAAAGAVVGLLYVLMRSEPEGSADAIGTVDVGTGDFRLGVPSLRVGGVEDVGGRTRPTIEASLLQARF